MSEKLTPEASEVLNRSSEQVEIIRVQYELLVRTYEVLKHPTVNIINCEVAQAANGLKADLKTHLGIID